MIEKTRPAGNRGSLPSSAASLRARLLAWYDTARRPLAWRAGPGDFANPYRVWISEIMLQQTTVATVTPYFERFVARWPTVDALAAAPLDDVLHAWQGLGYYARARNLHACAKVVAGSHGGRFPDTEEALRQLPGIGAYTAAAVAAIAFGRAAVPVDGNVTRVLSRLLAVTETGSPAKSTVMAGAQALADDDRAADFAQAIMELGALVCTPRRPDCAACPWAASCRARAEGRPEAYPMAEKKKEKPVRHGVAFWIVRDDGAILLRRRPERGLLGGMMEVPSTDWRPDQPWQRREAIAAVPTPGRCAWLDRTVRHTFTHFHLHLAIVHVAVTQTACPRGTWCAPERLADFALPTVMRKIVRAVGEDARAKGAPAA